MLRRVCRRRYSKGGVIKETTRREVHAICDIDALRRRDGGIQKVGKLRVTNANAERRAQAPHNDIASIADARDWNSRGADGEAAAKYDLDRLFDHEGILDHDDTIS